MRWLFKTAVGILYWPLAVLVMTTPIWVMIALHAFVFPALNYLWVAIGAMVVLFFFMISTWDHVVRPWIEAPDDDAS